ncbi:MAG: ATP-binding cassette, subfamily bacterial, partial [Acidimicrobiaceae bacterium]|nr:ATP-binding cassette, subfamily bacterial [Acidimicrobiaceae bacterium]
AMGYEAFSIEGARPQLAALKGLERLALPPVRRPAGATKESESEGVPVIEFEGVSFRYPGRSRDVLQGLELRLEPGESVAIVGENGAGKTTLLKLLCGFHQPDAGRITADGVDLRDLDPAWWRRRLAIIFQDFVRFELSARDNVALADLDQPRLDADITAAAAGAGAEELVARLPGAWDTVLARAYRGGAELSGGEWQRIALARALYASRVGGRVLILDEPTASLDVMAETALFDQLLEHSRGLTAIVVSHRFSTVRRASRIVVLADGRVAEDGSHAELVALGGAYERLYRLQADRFRSGDSA